MEFKETFVTYTDKEIMSYIRDGVKEKRKEDKKLWKLKEWRLLLSLKSVTIQAILEYQNKESGGSEVYYWNIAV